MQPTPNSNTDRSTPINKKALAGAAAGVIAATGVAVIALGAGLGHARDRQAHPRANHVQAAPEIWMPSASPEIWMP
ncbi:hypothetical protein [Actinoallomurus soli]|uniref:hypothetical protein n=1 Tax=Actinoallomurus soli TaxID=2952535 RepID=UPI0020938CB3|nr:hypothetical protein [Actinoallomurus soli]MCO5973156.1 hypothetical protein [Actinoallomurus soli]